MIGSQAWTLPLSGLVEVSQSSESPCPACTFHSNTAPRTTQLSHPTQSPDMEVFVKWGEGGKRRRGQSAATVITLIFAGQQSRCRMTVIRRRAASDYWRGLVTAR